jgi:hypothetical protein
MGLFVLTVTVYWNRQNIVVETTKMIIKKNNMARTLKQIKDDANRLRSSWNGKDAGFLFEGSLYRDEDVITAKEIVDKCEELEILLEEVYL